MTREELQHDFHNEQGINWENSQGEPDIDYVMWLENKIIAIKNNYLPPAEGAEKPYMCPVCCGNGLVPNGFYNTVSGLGSTTSITPETCRSCNGTGVIFAAQPQPTAEGAEEILKRKYANDKWEPNFNGIVEVMREFAAQPQPTAEGVEIMLDNSNLTYEEKMKLCSREIAFIEHMYGIGLDEFETALTPLHYLSAMHKFAAQQPIVEGAEEMVNSTFKLNTSFVGKEDVMFYKPQIISVMQEFATLHAQRIADKKYADTEADGYVFCGKCGKMKTI